MREVLVLSFFVTLAMMGHSIASEGTDDLAKLAKSGVNDEVILAFIDASDVAYDLSVDDILYFNDLGLSPKVVAAAVKHGKELREAGLATAAVTSSSLRLPR